MKVKTFFNDCEYEVDLGNPIDISIPLREGESNPNCYWADDPKFETIVSGDFVGSVAKGGPVNYQKLSITPHGNGTHTECYGHISPDGATINQSLTRHHFIAELITVEPASKGGDQLISKSVLESAVKHKGIEGLVVRTLPNSNEKTTRKYSGTNPPYFDFEALEFLAENNTKHLLVDLPSVDKEVDEGALKAHKAFWRYPHETRKEATITELIYVPNDVKDGLYLINLQIISLETDACPSKPLLYQMIRI